MCVHVERSIAEVGTVCKEKGVRRRRRVRHTPQRLLDRGAAVRDDGGMKFDRAKVWLWSRRIGWRVLVYGGLLVLLARFMVFPGAFLSLFGLMEGAPGWMAVHERVYEVDGTKLSGWLVERPGKPLAVFYGGNGKDAGVLASATQEFDECAWLLVNYRGYGRSEGWPSEEKMVDDAVAVLDRVVKESGRSMEDVVLVGQSIGSGVAVQVAARRKPGRLVLLVPFDSLLAVAKEKAPFLPVRWLVGDAFRSDKVAERVECPVFIFAGSRDTMIPPHHARTLSGLFPHVEVYREFDCGHNDIWGAEGFYPAMKRALRLDAAIGGSAPDGGEGVPDEVAGD